MQLKISNLVAPVTSNIIILVKLIFFLCTLTFLNKNPCSRLRQGALFRKISNQPASPYVSSTKVLAPRLEKQMEAVQNIRTRKSGLSLELLPRNLQGLERVPKREKENILFFTLLFECLQIK